MKIRNIIVSLAAAVLAAACTVDEPVSHLDGLDVSNDYMTLASDEGSNTSVTVTSDYSWTAETKADWISVSPASGTAGSSVDIYISATSASTAERTAEINIVAGDMTKIILVKQAAPEGTEAAPSTCKEIVEGPDITYRVTGFITKISNTHYGNWYINDGTITGDGVYVYGTLDKKGGANSSSNSWDNINDANYAHSWDLAVGDEVTIEGPKTVYNGTVELVDVTIVSVNKSLIKVEEIPAEPVTLEGGSFDVALTCKGDGISVNIPGEAKSWLSLVGITMSGSTATVTFNAAPNAGGDRTADLTFVTTSAGKSYTAQTSISQKGSILEVKCAEFNAKEDGNAQYRVSGIVTKIAQDSEKYGTNLYIKDASGEEVYLYGSVTPDGVIDPLVANHGVKVGDIITLVGPKSSYKGAAQMVKGYLENVKPVTTMKAADVAALADDDKNNPQNYIMLTGIVTTASGGNKTDLATYGNFDLVDESGSVYVYGVSTGWNGETKKFSTLGVKEGDEITIVAYKTSYKGAAQVVGMYVSHSTPAPVEEGKAVFTVDCLPSAYGDESVITAGATDYYINQVANFGSGIQLKKEVSYIANKTALGKIKKVTLVCAEGKTWYPGNLSFYAGSAEKPETEAEAVDSDCLVYDLSGKDFSFFKIANTSTYAVYLESITVEYE